MIKTTKNNESDTRVLKHFTRTFYLDSIFEIGIQLERWNAENQYAQGDRSEQLLVSLESSRNATNLIGRYVWLTRGDYVHFVSAYRA